MLLDFRQGVRLGGFFVASRSTTVLRSSSRSNAQANHQDLFKDNHDDKNNHNGVYDTDLMVDDDVSFHNVARRYWARQPFVVRGAFDATTLIEAKIWPSWQDILDLACTSSIATIEDSEADSDVQYDYGDDEKKEEYDDDNDDGSWWSDDEITSTGHSARLIRHAPGKLDSFEAQLGPFSRLSLASLCRDETRPCWSLLLNDVDRYHPSLADWMDHEFGSLLPRWRRDDAQISLAPTGGGIGPHVDSYDVFLIQAQGTREWRIQPSPLVTVQEEMDRLIPGLSVRILDLPETRKEQQLDQNPAHEYVSIHLQAGDVLYLPPRVTHWGISTSDDCMTLSVGCRAPAAQEMVARLAEHLLSSNRPHATHRFTELELPGHGSTGSAAITTTSQTNTPSSPSLTQDIRARMKEMVLQAIQEALHNETEWDALVGKLVTEPKRLAGLPTHTDQSDEYLDQWGNTPKKVLSRVRRTPTAVLRRAPGVSMATSNVQQNDVQNDTILLSRLYAHGEMWQVANDPHASNLFHSIEQGYELKGTNDLTNLSTALEKIVLDLISEGILIASLGR